jgi:hypothetical protein
MPVLERGLAAARAAGQLDALSQTLSMSSIAARMAGDRVSSTGLLDEARAGFNSRAQIAGWIAASGG